MISRENSRIQSILIVDYSTSNLDVLRKSLVSHKYQVELINSRESALHQATKFPPDLILLSLEMLTSGNLDITDYLDNLTKSNDIPILFFNGNISLDYKQKSNLGINAINYESFGVDILLLNIKSLLDIKSYREKTNHQKKTENILFFQKQLVFWELAKDDPIHQEQEELEKIQNNNSEAIFWQALLTRGYEIIGCPNEFLTYE